MAALRLRTFATLTSNFAAGVQGRAAALVDFSIGSVLRAVAEATASLALWLQGEIAYVLTLTRAATSRGSDLDTWVNDYGLTRLTATPASGLVTFARFTATADTTIPVGAAVQTADGSQRFTVVADALNPSYRADLAAYLMPAGVPALSVPVKANVPAAAGNVVAGAITTITSATPGIDTVRNAAAFANGADAETDEALNARKTLFFASLSRGTVPAIRFAVASLQLGVTCAVVENENRSGLPQPGFVYVVVDDGTGFPPDDLLAQVAAAMPGVRAAGVWVAVFPPTVLYADVVLTVGVRAGYDKLTVEAAVAKAVATFIDGLGLGTALPWSRLAQVAYDASPGVGNITGLTLNNARDDLAAAPRNVIKARNILTSVTDA